MTEGSLLNNFCGVIHCDATLQSLRDGAAAFEDRDGALGFFALTLGDLQVVFDAKVR